MEQAVDSGSAKAAKGADLPMVAAMGEALVDMIELPGGDFQPCLGGSVCNFAIGLARQGVPTAYLNPLSADSFGQRFAALFGDSGVKLVNAQPSSLPTSIAVVSVDAQGVASYAFHRECVADRDVSAPGLAESFPEPLGLLHTGGLALVPEDLAKTLQVVEAAKDRGALVSVDANVRLVAVARKQEYLEGVKHALTHAHIVKVSDEDLAHLGATNDSLDEARRLCLANGTTRLVALTRGSKGAALLTHRAAVELPTPAGLQVVDTVGAGDCFHAGLLAWLYRRGRLDAAATEKLDEDTLRAALEHAIAAASINVTRAGCDPATWDETRRYLDTALP